MVDQSSGNAAMAEAHTEANLVDQWFWRCQVCAQEFPHVEWHSNILSDHAYEHVVNSWELWRSDSLGMFDEVNAYEDLMEKLAGRQ